MSSDGDPRMDPPDPERETFERGMVCAIVALAVVAYVLFLLDAAW